MKIVKGNIVFVQISDLECLKDSLPKTINIDKIVEMVNEEEKDFFVAFVKPEEKDFFKNSNIPEYDNNVDNNEVAKVLSK